jgi:hypothetical protein
MYRDLARKQSLEVFLYRTTIAKHHGLRLSFLALFISAALSTGNHQPGFDRTASEKDSPTPKASQVRLRPI